MCQKVRHQWHNGKNIKRGGKLKNLLQYLFGYIHVRIEGFFVERVINRAMSRKMSFWNIKRDKSTIVYANVGLGDFDELLKIVEENQCKMEKLNESGLPFVMKKYKKRKIFFIVVFLICFVLLTASNFVWNIEIEGLQSIDYNELMQELNSNGLKIGILKGKVDEDSIINKIRLDRKDISWIGIELSRYKCISKSCRSRNEARNNR